MAQASIDFQEDVRENLSGNLNVAFGKEKRYLIRVNGESVGLLDREDDAIKAMTIIAFAEEKKLNGPDRSIFWKHLDGGKKIQLYTQTHGRLFQGSLIPEVTIDMISIYQMKYVSPYADKIAQYKASKQKTS